MTTPFKHLSYLLLSGLFVTAMACGSDTTDDAGNDDTILATSAEALPPPTSPMDSGMAGDTMNGGMGMASTGNPDQDFATQAAAMNLAEIRAHQTALDRATTAEVKQHAQHMLTDHKQMDADMKSLAARKNIVLPAQPRQDKVAMQDEMNRSKQGKEWDAAYVASQIQDHREAIALFENGERTVQDPDLKKLITSTLPKLRSHLKMVEEAQTKLQ